MDKARLMAERKNLRASLTKACNNFMVTVESEDASLEDLRDSIELIQIKQAELSSIDIQLSSVWSDEHLEKELQEAEKYRDKTSLVQVKLRRFERTHHMCNASQASVSAEPAPIGPRTKLPTLDFPKFNGSLLQWTSFQDHFHSMIDSNPQLSDIDKFNYLKLAVEGIAAKTLEGYALTAANYKSAWKALSDQFGQTSLLVQAYLDDFQSLQRVSSSSKVKDLRALYTKCTARIRSLEALDVETDNLSVILVPLVLRCVPVNLGVLWKKQAQAPKDKLSDLMIFFKTELEALESVWLLLEDHSLSVNSKNIEPNFKVERLSDFRADQGNRVPEKKRTAFNLCPTEVEEVKRAVSKNSPFCVYCKGTGHYSSECGQYVELEKRKDILLKQHCCFVCLGIGHVASGCYKASKGCSRCHRRHHVSLCREKLEGPPSRVRAGVSVASNFVNSVFLPTAQIMIQGEAGKVRARCLLDAGSQTTFVCQRVAERVGARCLRDITLSVQPFASQLSTSVYSVYELFLQGISGGPIVTVSAVGSEKFCSDLAVPSDPEILSRLAKRQLHLADPLDEEASNSSIDLLLGSDVYWRVITGRMERITESVGVTETVFGWMISGNRKTEAVKVQVQQVATIENDLKQWWELEHLGIVAKQPDADLVTSFRKDINRTQNGRYIVRMPWNEKATQLASNWNEAFRRMKGLSRRLWGNTKMQEGYRKAVKEYFDMHQAEEIQQPDKSEGVVYYVPHHAVVKEERTTTKVRVVFDASSHAGREFSLNDCVHIGPSQLPEVLELLLRFRCYAVPFTGDITKAFLQVRLATEDQDAVRFLWLRDWFWDYPWSENSFRKALYIAKMVVVTFGVAASPFLFCAAVRHHALQMEDQFPIAGVMLQRNLYMDDLLGGADTVEEAFVVAKQCKEILADAQISMCKWLTSSIELHNRWKEAGEEVLQSDLPLSPAGSAKLLGMRWSCLPDEFFFTIKELEKKAMCTKRIILKTVASIFDPLGFLSPFTLRAKLLLQKIWEAKIDWDELLPQNLIDVWKIWTDELKELEKIRIPRFIGIKRSNTPYSLHVFSDASARAMCVTIYIRLTKEPVVVTLLMAKSRVAPLKTLSIPRLELTAAVLGTRLVKYILHAIDDKPLPDYVVFWCDAQVVLSWIRNKKRATIVYVQNRVQEIRSNAQGYAWRFCPGTDNPADMGTRGESVDKLAKEATWWRGPVWLAQEDTAWPADIQDEDLALEAITNIVNRVFILEPVLDLTRFSSLRRVLRVTVWLFRAFRFKEISPDITATELEGALTYWIKRTQEENFCAELESLRQGEFVSKKSRLLFLCPFLDNQGILRLGGRLQQSGLKFETIHPIILPSGGCFVDLIFKETHHRMFHVGPQETLAEVRNRFWVLRGRIGARRAVSSCLICRRFKVKPTTVPTAPLPEDRVTQRPPFSCVGIDFAGPLWVWGEGRRDTVKVYIVLYSCAVTRALFLDLISSMHTEQFLLSLRRFFGIYGVSEDIYSDNGRTFHWANKELRGLWSCINNPQVANFCAARGLQWHFIIERAAWWGGFWERMVKSVKHCIRRVIGRQILSFEELQTFLFEVAAVINSRPLCYVSSDYRDKEPLTPGHFLRGSRISSLPFASGTISLPGAGCTELVKRWKFRVRLLENFWKRWQRDYLLLLRSIHLKTVTGQDRDLQAGDIVLLEVAHAPRCFWQMGRIVEIYPGRDNRVRACRIKLSSGSELRRAAQHLFRLEV